MNPLTTLFAVERGSLNGRGTSQAQVNIFSDGGHNQLRLRLGEEHTHALESTLRAGILRAGGWHLQGVYTIHAHNTLIRVGKTVKKPQ